MPSANPLLTWEATLGEPLLRFVLNRDEGPLDEELDDARQMVLYDLDSGGVIGPGDDPRYPVALGGVTGDEPSSAWKLRARSGGAIPEPPGDDSLGCTLTLIARDSYPVLLSLPDLIVEFVPGRSLPASDPSIGLSQLVTAHPVHDVAQRELAAEAEGWQDVVVESILSRDRLRGAPTPDAVISAAAERWQHHPDADVGHFLDDVLGCLAALRNLGAGKTVEAVAVVGLRGLELEPDLEYELPVGLLRTPTDHEARYAPFFQGSTEVDAVLVVPTRLTPTPPAAAAEVQMKKQLEIAEVARTVSLAAALARREERDSLAAVAVSWITEWTPMQGSGSFKPGPIERLVLKVAYGEAELNRLGDWIERVQGADIGHISIAVDRILRAIFEVEAAESLIDAVIAWENLFGSRIETAYKVTASLMVLCEDDPGKRIEFRKELDKLYGDRSRLVHGDQAGAEFEARNRAIQIGLEAIARLIEKRPDLLELAKSSRRADRLLLSVDN